MDVGGVQESRSQLCYRKEPLTPEKKKEKKPHDFWKNGWGFWASKLSPFSVEEDLSWLDSRI